MSDLAIWTFAQVQDLSGANVLIGRCNDFRVAIVFENDVIWSKDADELGGPALWFPDVEFEVDPSTFAVFDHIDEKPGALAIQNGRIFIAVPPPSKAGYVLVEVGEAAITEGTVTYGFTEWRAVVRFGDESFTLFERRAAR